MQAEAHNMINSILEDAIDDGLVYRNVCRKATIGKKKKPVTSALTVAERRVIPTCDFTLEERYFVYILWYAGLRPEEVRALTVHSIALSEEVIHVENFLAFGKNQGHLKEPKTYAGTRDIDILPPLLPILTAYCTFLLKHTEICTLRLHTGGSGKRSMIKLIPVSVEEKKLRNVSTNRHRLYKQQLKRQI